MGTESNYETLYLTGEEAVDKVRDPLKHFGNAMMITSANGFPHSGPMGLQGKAEEFNSVLWFFPDRQSGKVEEIWSDPSVSLVFDSDGDHAYVHLFGRAEVIYDHPKMDELYTPLLKTWFPEGLDDPCVTLIRFEADNGDFWDSPGGMLQILGAFTKAIVTGKRAQGGEVGEVALT